MTRAGLDADAGRPFGMLHNESTEQLSAPQLGARAIALGLPLLVELVKVGRIAEVAPIGSHDAASDLYEDDLGWSSSSRRACGIIHRAPGTGRTPKPSAHQLRIDSFVLPRAAAASRTVRNFVIWSHPSVKKGATLARSYPLIPVDTFGGVMAKLTPCSGGTGHTLRFTNRGRSTPIDRPLCMAPERGPRKSLCIASQGAGTSFSRANQAKVRDRLHLIPRTTHLFF